MAFGFPFKQDALYRLDGIRVTNPASGKPLPLQVNGLALWPDGSIKSALLQVCTTLAPNAEQPLNVEFGNEVKGNPGSSIQLTQEEKQWIIHTGKITAIVSKANFAPPGIIRAGGIKGAIIAHGEGLRLVDEKGALFASNTAPLASLAVERIRNVDLVLHAEGPLHSQSGDRKMKHITRLRFFNNSARVEVTVSIINDVLAHEFLDIKSLTLDVAIPSQNGILLLGISKYHELTGDPQAVEVLKGASEWLAKSWREERAWPYSAHTDGSPVGEELLPNANPLIYPALAYTGRITGNNDLITIASKAFDATFPAAARESHPKEFSMKMYATPWVLSLLENGATPASQ